MPPSTPDPLKATLVRYLDAGREALLWKLDGLTPYQQRRPLTPTGTTILGTVKHVAWVEAGYLGATFNRPFPEPDPADPDGLDPEPNADFIVNADESTADIVALTARVAAHSRATIDALEVDSPGAVPWWSPDRREVTLGQILVHLVAEFHRHAGQVDILRESLDGEVGLRPAAPNMPDAYDWAAHVARLEALAAQAK